MKLLNLRIDCSRLSANAIVKLFNLLRLECPARLSDGNLITIHCRISRSARDNIWRLINRHDVAIYQQITPFN